LAPSLSTIKIRVKTLGEEEEGNGIVVTGEDVDGQW
jgi:hypothetical protein